MAHGHAPVNPHDTAAHLAHQFDEHDSWFRHSAEEPAHQNAHGETNAWGIIGFMVVTLVLVGVTSAAVYYALFEPMLRRSFERNEAALVHTEYVSARNQWVQQLSNYAWIDPAAGRVRMPLEAAQRRVVLEYTQAARRGGGG